MAADHSEEERPDILAETTMTWFVMTVSATLTLIVGAFIPLGFAAATLVGLGLHVARARHLGGRDAGDSA